ncbi:MAG: hypothetical protein HC860_17300 [Alkalinema sp. RU_4_3]|nr:hypothetical protein [Alkalinema sp. RU_4_3]
MVAYLSDFFSTLEFALENLNLGSLNLGSLNLDRLSSIVPSLVDFADDRTSLLPNANNLSRIEGFSQIVVFGDSLSDTGNLANLLVDYGLPTTEGFSPILVNGRISNGPLWIETLAANWSLNPLQVKNFATIGSTTGRSNISSAFVAFLPPEVVAEVKLPGILDQIDRYGSTLTAPADPQALHIIWGGAADFYQMPGKTWAEAIAQVNQSVNNVIASVEQLASLGPPRSPWSIYPTWDSPRVFKP